MRILCLIDGGVDPPDRWIWNDLPAYAQRDVVDFVGVAPRDLFPGWGKLLTYYPAYWSLALRALWQSHRADYDLIVAWESKNGFPLAFLRSLLGMRKPPLVILAFAYKGIAMHFPQLGRLGMHGADHITVSSSAGVGYYSRLLALPLRKVSYCPEGWYDFRTSTDAPQANSDQYVFSGGRSGRDYGTLFEAVSGQAFQLVVNARRFNLLGLVCPPNVTINDLMPLREYTALMAGSQFVVLPLHETPHPAGIGHVIQAMSAGKALVATHTTSTVDYVEEGRTGLLVAPYDAQAMRSAIAYLMAHPERTRAMGQEARRRYEREYTFAAFSVRIYDVLQKVAVLGRQG